MLDLNLVPVNLLRGAPPQFATPHDGEGGWERGKHLLPIVIYTAGDFYSPLLLGHALHFARPVFHVPLRTRYSVCTAPGERLPVLPALQRFGGNRDLSHPASRSQKSELQQWQSITAAGFLPPTPPRLAPRVPGQTLPSHKQPWQRRSSHESNQRNGTQTASEVERRARSHPRPTRQNPSSPHPFPTPPSRIQGHSLLQGLCAFKYPELWLSRHLLQTFRPINIVKQ